MSGSSHYKYCFVPSCTNTTTKTPQKLFFCLPRDSKERKKWCKMARRNGKEPFGPKSQPHCCEDHFDIENDMENYIRWKIMGGKKKLKKGILPHKFEWTEKNTKERAAVEKRRLREFYERVLSPEIHHEDLLAKPVEFIGVEGDDVINDPIDVPEPEIVPKKTFQNKGVQCSLQLKQQKKKYRSKQIQCEPEKKIMYSVGTDTDDRFDWVMRKKRKLQKKRQELLRRRDETLRREAEKRKPVPKVEADWTPSEASDEDFKGGSSDEYQPERKIRASSKLIKTRSKPEDGQESPVDKQILKA